MSSHLAEIDIYLIKAIENDGSQSLQIHDVPWFHNVTQTLGRQSLGAVYPEITISTEKTQHQPQTTCHHQVRMLEIACFNASSAIKAARAGASRIELCADYAAGGVTPPLSSIQTFRAAFPNHPVNVMIRPRAGDFVYTDEEFSKMKASIEEFKPFASGFVFGILNGDSQVDISRNRELVELAGLSCTFHRAFDQIENKDKAAKDVVGCGFTSVLTSGGGKDATSGVDVVADLFEKYGDRVAFIAGGGVRSSNVEELKRKTGVEWYHSAAITSPGEEVDEGEVVLLRKVLAKSTSSF